jgi:hypothetical protein
LIEDATIYGAIVYENLFSSSAQKPYWMGFIFLGGNCCTKNDGVSWEEFKPNYVWHHYPRGNFSGSPMCSKSNPADFYGGGQTGFSIYCSQYYPSDVEEIFCEEKSCAP